MEIMGIKRKHLTVVLFSSAIIALVIVSTLVGYSLYVQWKEDTFAVDYRNSIYRLNAEIFKNDIEIHGVRAGLRNSGLPSETPVLEGKVKNDSSKTITSIMLEVSFSISDGSVIYRDWFYPFGEGAFSGSPFFSGIKRTREVLRPGESMAFNYPLRNCPSEVIARIFPGKGFAKTAPGRRIEFNVSVSGVSVL